jgi:hypothetical protein
MDMTTGSMLLALALLVLTGLYVLRPLLVPWYHRSTHMGTRELLEHDKAGVLEHIRALEFEFETGKLPEAEYERDRAALLQQAAGLLRQIEQLPPETDLDGRIEAAIRQWRQESPPAKAAPLVQSPAAGVVSTIGRFCTQCGTPAAPDHRFCAKCGAPLP